MSPILFFLRCFCDVEAETFQLVGVAVWMERYAFSSSMCGKLEAERRMKKGVCLSRSEADHKGRKGPGTLN